MNGTYHDHYETVNEAGDEGDYANGDRLLQVINIKSANQIPNKYIFM